MKETSRNALLDVYVLCKAVGTGLEELKKAGFKNNVFRFGSESDDEDFEDDLIDETPSSPMEVEEEIESEDDYEVVMGRHQ